VLHTVSAILYIYLNLMREILSAHKYLFAKYTKSVSTDTVTGKDLYIFHIIIIIIIIFICITIEIL